VFAEARRADREGEDLKSKLTILTRRVESKIFVIHGRKVILDSDLARLYGVKVKRLNEQVKRNSERFPADFVFRVRDTDLRSQIATSKLLNRNDQIRGSGARGGRRYRPYAFSEHGAIMAATVLNSKTAVEMSIYVVRAFVHMREAVATNQRIIAKLRDLERKVAGHDADIDDLVAAIREMMRPLPPNARRIGFAVPGSAV
jgi:hypothetical protein